MQPYALLNPASESCRSPCRLSGGRYICLSLARVNELGSTQQLVGAMLEYLEKNDVDHDVARVEVSDDALHGRVQLRRHDEDLVRLLGAKTEKF